MSRLAIIDFRSFEKILLRLGFKRTRQRGSHVIYHHKDGRIVSVPYHKGKDLSRQLLRSLLKQIDITVDDYNNLLN